MSVDTAAVRPLEGAAGSSGRPRAFETIVYGGLVVGVLDITDAIVFWWVRNGVSPTRILQSVASGLLGDAAREGGWATALLGLLLHFLIAFAVAAVYYGASQRLPQLVRRAVLSGLAYGVAVYFVMTYVVLPLSAFPQRASSFALAPFLNGIIGHALFVGLPVALIARRSARRKESTED